MSAKPLPRAPQNDALATLAGRWADAARTLRWSGDERGAALVERLTGELEAALGASHAPQERPAAAPANADRLLTVREAAERLSVAPTWIHRHWRVELRDCARVLGRRTLRFSERALDERCRRLQLGKL
jgi:hypothetical protein